MFNTEEMNMEIVHKRKSFKVQKSLCSSFKGTRRSISRSSLMLNIDEMSTTYYCV